MIPFTALPISASQILYFTGPAAEEGPLPALFYFALSGTDSLTLDPFNQPVQFLQGKRMRIFSLTLPGHENQLPPTEAIDRWAQLFSKGKNCLSEFLDQAQEALEVAIEQKLIDPHHIAVSGLSRGGFIAAHLAAREKRIRHLLGFAPLTSLKNTKEFSALQENPLVHSMELEHLNEALYDRHIRLYIGNQDTRVSTRSCFEWVMALVEKAKENRLRSPQIELILTPSIGHQGHGTSPATFQRGISWLTQQIL